MEHLSIEDARARLVELVEAALRGEHIVIESADERGVQLVPIVKSTEPRVPGSARGMIATSDDFDASIDDFDPYTG